MNLLSLLATLTLDATDYNKSLDDAQKKADDFTGVPDQKVGVDTSEFSDGIATAEDEATSFEQVLSGVWEGIKDGLKVAGVGAAISALVSQLTQAVNLAAKLGDDVDKGSKRMNLSTKAYQEWSHALGQSGTNINALQKGILTMNKALAGEDVGEKAAAAFEKLGVSPETASTTEEFLKQTVKALADFQGTEEERGVLANAIFGTSGKDLNALFDEGSKGIDDLLKETEELGLIMSDEDIQNAVDYSDAIANMQAAMDALKVSIGKELLPLLTDAANKVTKIIAFFNGGGEKSLADQFTEGDEQFAEEVKDIEDTAKAAETLADKLLAMGDTSKMTAEQYEIWKGTADALIEKIPSLGEVIDTESGKISANSAQIKENIKQWEALAKQKALQQLKEEKMSAIMDKQKDLVDKSVQANVKLSEAEGKRGRALEAVNKVMEKYGGEALGEGATVADYTKARADVLAKYSGDDEKQLEIMNEFTAASGEWTKAVGEATAAQAEVESINQEIEKGQQDFAAWEAAAEAMFGTTETDAGTAATAVDGLASALDGLGGDRTIHISVDEDDGTHAIGARYIPYDDYRAVLHRGERVLTAQEARNYGSNNVDLSNLEDRIISAIRAGMAGATVQAVVSGGGITNMVNTITSNELKGRRFAP